MLKLKKLADGEILKLTAMFAGSLWRREKVGHVFFFYPPPLKKKKRGKKASSMIDLSRLKKRQTLERKGGELDQFTARGIVLGAKFGFSGETSPRVLCNLSVNIKIPG